ncbi:MAG: hypothetical protein H6718_13685 [Polyangiaceae bacterium]|nr:hypothetical protein [Polyangiaceae bacterium]
MTSNHFPTFQRWLSIVLGWLTEPASPRRQRQLYWLVSLGALAGAVYHLTRPGEPLFPFDDSYITLHNAQVLLRGQDASYPGVSALYGTTSLPHVVLVALALLVLAPPHALLLTQWLAVLLYALGLLRLCFMHRTSWVFAAALTVTGLGVGLSVHQLFNGLETGLALAGIVWALVLSGPAAPRRPALLGLLLGVLPFIRPELLALSAPLGLLAMYRVYRARRSWKPALALAGFAALGALPWLLAYGVATHSLGPATVSAKQAFFAQGCAPDAIRFSHAWRAALEFGGEVGPWFCLGALLGLFSAPGRIALGFMLVFWTAYYMRFPGALSHYEHRYLYVFVPLLAYGFIQGAAQRWRYVALASTTVLLGVAAGVVSHDISGGLRQARGSRHFTETELAGLARWAEQNLPKDSPTAIHDAGYLAYATDLPLVDVVGLKTPDAVPLHQRLTRPSCGAQRAEAVLEIVRRHGAQHLIVYRNAFRLEPGLKQSGWHLEPVGPHPIQGKPYENWTPRYVVYRIIPPGN